MPLNTNWRGIANYYISDKDGLDSNSGLTPDLPKKTVANAVTTSGGTSATMRVRTGWYNNSLITSGNPNFTYIGDGFVVFDGSGLSPFYNYPSISRNHVFNNIYFRNIDTIRVGDDTAGAGARYFYCAFKIGTNINYIEAQRTLFIDCELNNDYVISYGATFTEMFRCTFINTAISQNKFAGPNTWKNCAFNSTATFSTTQSNKTFNTSAFQSGFSINGTSVVTVTLTGDANPIGTQYIDGQLFNGTATIGGQTITFVNCFWTADLGFNSASNDDYTLKVSPLSKLHNGSNIIGAYGTAIRFDATHSAFNPLNSGVIIPANVTIVGGNFQLTSGTEATIVSSDNPSFALSLPYYTYLTDAIRFFGAFNFNNGDWVDRLNYQAGINDEVRLTYRIRVYNEITSIWGAWYEMEINNVPRVDATGKGIGDVDANLTVNDYILGKIFQVEFTIRNNGV